MSWWLNLHFNTNARLMWIYFSNFTVCMKEKNRSEKTKGGGEDNRLMSRCLFQHDAQMDYYGTRLATCSSDRTVKIFDVRNGGQILVADLRG